MKFIGHNECFEVKDARQLNALYLSGAELYFEGWWDYDHEQQQRVLLPIGQRTRISEVLLAYIEPSRLSNYIDRPIYCKRSSVPRGTFKELNHCAQRAKVS